MLGARVGQRHLIQNIDDDDSVNLSFLRRSVFGEIRNNCGIIREGFNKMEIIISIFH